MGERAKSGEVVALRGDLGAGKTVFARGFARGLGIEEEVTSPTFTIRQTYRGAQMTLEHVDAYRLEEPEEMYEIGEEDCFCPEGAALVEWPERVEELLPEGTVQVRIDRDPVRGADYRRITVEGAGGGV